MPFQRIVAAHRQVWSGHPDVKNRRQLKHVDQLPDDEKAEILRSCSVSDCWLMIFFLTFLTFLFFLFVLFRLLIFFVFFGVFVL